GGRFTSTLAPGHQRAGHQPAAGGDDPDARVLHLTFSALAAKLARALDHVTDRVQPAPRKASAVRIRRDLAPQCDVSVLDKRTSFAFRAKAEILHPAQRETRDAA